MSDKQIPYNETTDYKIERLKELRNKYKRNTTKNGGWLKQFLSPGSWDGLSEEEQEYIKLKRDLMQVFNRLPMYGKNEDTILRIKLTELLHNDIEREAYSKILGIKFKSPNDTEHLVQEFKRLFPKLPAPQVAKQNNNYLKLELIPGKEVEMLQKLAKKNISFSVLDPINPDKVICEAKNGKLINAVTNQEYKQGELFNPSDDKPLEHKSSASASKKAKGDLKSKMKETLTGMRAEAYSEQVEKDKPEQQITSYNSK